MAKTVQPQQVRLLIEDTTGAPPPASLITWLGGLDLPGSENRLPPDTLSEDGTTHTFDVVALYEQLSAPTAGDDFDRPLPADALAWLTQRMRSDDPGTIEIYW